MIKRQMLAFLLLSWLAIGAVVLVVNDALDSSFRAYIAGQANTGISPSLIDNLQQTYTENGTWEAVQANLPGHGRQGSGQGRQLIVVDLDGQIVAATDATRIGSHLTDYDQTIALRDGDAVVAWIVTETEGQQRLGEAEQRFLDEMNHSIVIVALAIGALSVLVGGLLSWHLVQPIAHLKNAALNIAQGQRGQQVPLSGASEIAALARAFNTMSLALQRSEKQRQRMAADMAHELRTPVTVLSGQLQGMLDGVVADSKDQIAVAYDQTLQLKRLIEDLRLLTLAEVRQLPLDRQAINLKGFVQTLFAGFEPLALDADINLHRDLPADANDIVFYGDPGRLRQVFGNLLTNALRHTPPGGTIRIEAGIQDKMLHVNVINSGQKLTPEQLANIFNPFWRADEARARDYGGSGLGLAIAQQLVALHDGTIHVENQPSGVMFKVVLPLVEPSAPDSANKR